MTIQNKQICSNFVQGIDLKQANRNLFLEDRQGIIVIYSYGYHFPMGIKLLDGTILINKNKYSRTTSKQQTLLKSELGYKDFLEFTTIELKEIILKGIKTKLELTEQKL